MVLLLALAGGGLIALSPDIALPLVVLLLPGLLALVLDRSPGCGVARAILLFQGAACVHPVINAWYRCAGIDGCMNYLAEWHSVLPVWLAAAAAWVMTQILPMGLKLLDDYRIAPPQRRPGRAAQGAGGGMGPGGVPPKADSAVRPMVSG